MSSVRKDARWQLADDMMRAAKVNPDHIHYSQRQKVLDAAEVLLDYLPSDEALVNLAGRWNKEEA